VRKDLPKPRMFRLRAVRGRALPSTAGLLVVARRGKTVTAQLRVFVLENRIVRLAVRPLQTAPGVFHAKVRPDPVAFVYEMNEIWAPQANVLIDLVPSKPALIDDPDQIARDLGAFEAERHHAGHEERRLRGENPDVDPRKLSEFCPRLFVVSRDGSG
jgi:hypothetical protein